MGLCGRRLRLGVRRSSLFIYTDQLSSFLIQYRTTAEFLNYAPKSLDIFFKKGIFLVTESLEADTSACGSPRRSFVMALGPPRIGQHPFIPCHFQF